MRFLVALVLTGALAVVGCGDDEANGTGGTGGGTAGTGGAGATGGTGGAGGGTGGSGGSTGADPEITNIEWAPVGACNPADPPSPGDYTVTVTATDADTDVMDLTYTGSVTGCSPTTPIDAMESTVNCPNVQPYTGTVVVMDLDGNASSSATFTIGVCETSSCDGNPGVPCSL